MNNDDQLPDWLRPAVLAMFFGTIGLVLLVLVLVILGVADPKPLGTLTVDNQQPVDLALDPADHTIYQPAAGAVHCPCTIEASMRQTSGDSITQVGLYWRTPDALTVAAVNGNAYYAIFDESSIISEWQRFPWLLSQPETNRLRLDFVADGSAILRLNDEVAVNFTWIVHSPIEIGFYASAPDSPAALTISRLRVWSSK